MRGIAIALVVCSILASVAFTGVNENAKVAIHVLAYDAKRSCTSKFPVINHCSDIITTYAGTNVHFFPVWFDLAGCTAVEYGVTWEGGTCDFKNCADFIIGNIVNSGDGASHAWMTCQESFAVIPGFGWISDSSDLIRIVRHPMMGGPNVTDCTTPKPIMDSLPPISCGFAGTNGSIGCDPCGLSVEPTTWGQIKALFR